MFTTIGLLVLVLILLSESTINSYKDSTYTPQQIDEIPHFHTALLLGTSKYVRQGGENLYYRYRLEAAHELWKQGIVEEILISGDNRVDNYNEPKTFKEDLMKMGVPDSIIFMDPLGLRTYDSVIRSLEVYGCDSVLIVSQPFQNLRALFIADKKGIFAKAYNASDGAGKEGFNIQFRERLARVKALLDVYVLNTKPQNMDK